MSESKLESLSEFSSATTEQQELFKPYPANHDFVQFSLDEGLDILVLNEGSFNLSKGYSDKRVVLVLRDYIHGRIALDDATRAILDFLPAEGATNGSGAFGSCILHTAEQIPYYHPGGQARAVQLLSSVYNSLGPGARNQLVIMIYENFEPDLDDNWTDRPTPGDPPKLALNFLAFLAARLSQDGMLNMTSEAIWTMRRLKEQCDDPQYANCNVSLAALWILFSGQSLYTEVVEAPPVTKEGAKNNALHEPGKLYKSAVYGPERWIFWRDMLKAVGEKEGLNSVESRKLATNAVDLMDAIDKGAQF